MIYKKIKIAAAFIIGSTCFLQAQAPKYSNEFLAIGVGAKALGMGNTNVVSCNDVSSGYYNPAGLLKVQSKIQLGLMHSEYFAGIAKYDYGALAVKLDSNSAGAISLIRFGVDNIPNTLDLVDANGNVDYDKITTFSATDFAAIISYARKIPKLKGVDIGANAKIIRRRIGDFGGSWGFGLDVGAKYNYKNWQFAAVGRDITGTFNAWSYNLTDQDKQTLIQTNNDIPSNGVETTLPRIILGAARSFSFFKDKLSLTAEMNLVNTFDGKRNVLIKSNFISTDPTLGLELSYKKLIYLRTGLNNLQKATDDAGKETTTIQPNLGLGIQYKNVALDYALTDIGDKSTAMYSNVFSLRININKKKN